MIQTGSPWLSHLWTILNGEVKLGSIIHWPSGSRFEHALGIASATHAHITSIGWGELTPGARREDDGTIRYNSAVICGSVLSLKKYIATALWLTQANHIFNRLKIVSNHKDYKLVNWVAFTLEIGKTTQNPPDGYLFVCSPKEFETGPTSFRWPDRPAYWSLDPCGSKPLSHEEASSLGFPPITPRTRVDAIFWDETVYAGLRKFDGCKRFNPESQDLAKKLGYPLYEVSVSADAMVWDVALDRDDSLSLSLDAKDIEEYTTEDDLYSQRGHSIGMESESDLASSHIEELAMEDEDFLHESFSRDTIAGQHYSVWELAELIKLGLILVLSLVTLYEIPLSLAVAFLN
ncbi:hypothetical protein MSAN_02006100 [Mycena sanguinolenta]|uniref:Uncharacterized protein n=1 Tax=Mycena sanguinolenta TaxID=230812 RepID=A0A8H7CNY4_9AGAR|nr:hypothetical protein MSAN_02006100 [Mycena sanguinolenta]